MAEERALPESPATKLTTQRLRNMLSAKEIQLLANEKQLKDMELVNSSACEKVTLCENQLHLIKTDINTLIKHYCGLDERIEILQAEIEDRTSTNIVLMQDNYELKEILCDLRAQLTNSRSDSSSDLLNASNTGSASFSIPENLADAVMEIRLADLQKQNIILIEELACVRGERETQLAEIAAMATALQLESDKCATWAATFEEKIDPFRRQTATTNEAMETLQANLKSMERNFGELKKVILVN